jgi:hypothetical protein
VDRDAAIRLTLSSLLHTIGTMESQEKPRSRRLLRLGLALLLLLAAGVAALWFLPRIEPAWYEPPDVQDEEVIELAGTVENRFVEELHLVRQEPAPWRLRIREQHVNAWLAVRLRAWVEHEREAQWPEQLHMVQVHFEEAGVNFAMDFREAGGRQVITARFVPAIEDGRLRIRLDQVLVGRIAISGDPLDFLLSFLGDQIAETADAEATSTLEQVRRLIRGEETLPAQITLGDGRRVAIDEVLCKEGAIELTSRTQANAE